MIYKNKCNHTDPFLHRALQKCCPRVKGKCYPVCFPIDVVYLSLQQWKAFSGWLFLSMLNFEPHLLLKSKRRPDFILQSVPQKMWSTLATYILFLCPWNSSKRQSQCIWPGRNISNISKRTKIITNTTKEERQPVRRPFKNCWANFLNRKSNNVNRQRRKQGHILPSVTTELPSNNWFCFIQSSAQHFPSYSKYIQVSQTHSEFRQ